jgi:hypothetical protein|tara:strand:+ start:506 stop:754 length:249 start_codon:yes stop_codon:yes gene_type:complete
MTKTGLPSGSTIKDLLMSQPSSEYNDYPADEIAAKLKQVIAFENKYKPNSITKSWRKWCTDDEYRKREWSFRQATANNLKSI